MAQWLCIGGPLDGEAITLPDDAEFNIDSVIKIMPHNEADEPDPSQASYYRIGADNSFHHDPKVQSCP